MNSVRIFFIGGYLAYRALFNWIHWTMYVPTMLGGPIFQILFFAYVGRYAGLRSDEFFVIGNAVQYAAIPCLFAMTFTIGGERFQHTLGYILVSPAPRLPLFLGRALPVVANGFFVAAFSLVVGGLIVGIHVPASSYAPLALATLICAFSCTGLGLTGAGIGLLMREQAVLANIMFGVLLIFTGANVPVDQLPGWMQSISNVLPFTHGIEAAREVADGASLADVSDLLAIEVGLGLAYGAFGYLFIRNAERLSLRHATLDRA